MNGSLIDIHAHILPELDDGARSMEEALTMARLAVDSGVRTVVVTPHSPDAAYLNSAASVVEAKTREFQYVLRREGIPLRVLPGMEVFVTENTPQHLRRGQVLPLAGTRYVLSEFSFSESPDFIAHMLSQIRHVGFVPIVAHPERYYCVQDTPQFAVEWRGDGCPLQLDKSSILGDFGEGDRIAAEWLLKNGAADVVASDGHTPYRRTTSMKEIVNVVAALTSPQTAEEVFWKTPYRILCDRIFSNGQWEGEEN